MSKTYKELKGYVFEQHLASLSTRVGVVRLIAEIRLNAVGANVNYKVISKNGFETVEAIAFIDLEAACSYFDGQVERLEAASKDVFAR